MECDKVKALHYYASQGIYFEVQTLVDEGVVLDIKNSDGKTSLMLAVEGSHQEVIKLLINSGADIHCCDSKGRTALHYALETIPSLKRIAIDFKESNSRTSLLMAADHLQSEIVELFINSGADIHSCINRGRTVLHFASQKGWVSIVKCLVSKGVALDLKDPHGRTSLMLAVVGLHQELIKQLINLGADIHCCDNRGQTALNYALDEEPLKRRNAYDFMESDGGASLLMAAYDSQREIVELLINSGADIHCCNNRGGTLLHFASQKGWVAIVKCLVSKGVALDLKDSRGRTSLMLAVEGSHREVIKQLINLGADIHCCDNKEWTALHYALDGRPLLKRGIALDIKKSDGEPPLLMSAHHLQREIIELLINSGANIHCCNNRGWTVLHFASQRGWVELVKCLVSKGVALDIKKSVGITSKGRTALMMAVRSSHRKVVELLIKSGADIHCFDDRGWTVLHHAITVERSTVQLLLNKGAHINSRTSYSDTPLHVALRFGKIEMVEYLLKAGADCNLKDNEGISPFSLLLCFFSFKRTPVEIIKLCIEKGAYVKSTDYNNLLEDPSLKKFILQDVKLCSQAIINKFNNKDLPLLYKGLASSQELPDIHRMQIGNESGMALEVKQAVANEIQAKGFCNIFEMVPLVLGMLCVRSCIQKSKSAFNQANLSESQNGLKRLRYNKQEYPCKKNCN